MFTLSAAYHHAQQAALPFFTVSCSDEWSSPGLYAA
jgi:hypothetical protein